MKNEINWSSRNGPKEILYKADLNFIASDLERIPGCNLNGTNPEMIIGLPLKLLHILNSSTDLIQKLFEEEGIEKCRKTYRRFCGFIGNKIPSFGQWQYLEKLCDDEGFFSGQNFSRPLYDRLRFSEDGELVEEYEQFLRLREEIPGIKNIKIKLPRPEDIYGFVEKLSMIKEYGTKYQHNDKLISERKKQADYEYYGEKYLIVMPESCLDICKEALSQSNCAVNFIDTHACGETTIVFLRKRSSPDNSFVTVEVKDKAIVQVFGKCNTFPKKEVYLFLEEYARKFNLSFDPYKLIIEMMDEVDGAECDGELWNYSYSYYKNNYSDQNDYEDDQINGQITLKDYCPELFS